MHSRVGGEEEQRQKHRYPHHTATLICDSCGSYNPEDAKFCIFCGNELLHGYLSSTKHRFSYTNKRKRRALRKQLKLIISTIVLVSLALTVSVVCLYVYDYDVVNGNERIIEKSESDTTVRNEFSDSDNNRKAEDTIQVLETESSDTNVCEPPEPVLDNQYMEESEDKIAHVIIEPEPEPEEVVSTESIESEASLVNEDTADVEIEEIVNTDTQEEVAIAPIPVEPTVVATPTVSSSQIEDLINHVPLYPVSTGSISVDSYIDSVLAQITTPNMTTYEKVKAIYDYMINHTRYEAYIYILDDGSMVPYDGDQDCVSEIGYAYGYQTLYSGRGVCDTYSCAFSMLCRRIGLNSYVVCGQTHKSGGGYTAHAWSIINIDGVEYICDPQIDDNIAKGGPIAYYRFLKTYEQVPGKYILEGINDLYMLPLY